MDIIKFCKKPLVASSIVWLILIGSAALLYYREQLYKNHPPFSAPGEKTTRDFPVTFILSALGFSIAGAVFTLYLKRRIEEEKRINKAIISAQEHERMQIGMELHDNVKQILAASSLYLGLLDRDLDDKPQSLALVENLKSFNQQAIDELRKLSHQLAPSIHDQSSLPEVVTRLIKTMKLEDRLQVSLKIDNLESQLRPDIQLHLYRMLQEQLGNILEYAQAESVEIIIEQKAKTILMQVRDDGQGFDTNSRYPGIGLKNIRRRAELMNGKVKISSAPGQGCSLKVEIPS
jgi:signal transduction histidine kinase